MILYPKNTMSMQELICFLLFLPYLDFSWFYKCLRFAKGLQGIDGDS